MKKEKILKLLSVWLLVSCAFVTSVSGRVHATDPVGETSTILAGPIPFGGIAIHSLMPSYFAQIETFGLSDVYMVHRTIDPGGHTGWHSHPGVVIVTVVSGAATEYHGDDPTCTPVVHTAGTGFTEEAGEVHIVRNEGSTTLEVYQLVIVPSGVAPRIDEPDPGNCPF
jgi:quercetin dioxygenase-like cupin family protein